MKKSKWQSSSEDEDVAKTKERRKHGKKKRRTRKEESLSQLAEPPTTSPPPPPALFRPVRLLHGDNFRDFSSIYESEQNTVQRAWDVNNQRWVVIKGVTRGDGDGDDHAFMRESMLREVRAMRQLGAHPHLLQLHEVVLDDKNGGGSFHLVLKYAEGGTVASCMDAMSRHFLLGEVKTITLHVLRALAHIHHHYYVHRDVKTANLFLCTDTEDAQQMVVKLGDFDAARQVPSRDSRRPPMTPERVTLWYRAPELLLSAKGAYDESVDMWSVGCVFGELVLGEAVFQGRSAMDQLRRVVDVCGWPGDGDDYMTRYPQWLEFEIKDTRSSSRLSEVFSEQLSAHGMDLMRGLLAYDPHKRTSAKAALKHPYFSEAPMSKPLSLASLSCKTRE